mmetsp:Transcript_897/g.710  ORF Transcript_897/g.710 Transcript_897/m.710 type:complete len:119 (+) Transcript_897:345-701(+)
MEFLESKLKSNKRKIIRLLSDGVVHTKTQKRIINKLYQVYFYDLKTFFAKWKTFAFNKLRLYHEKLKGRVIDKFVYAGMSKERRVLIHWSKYCLGQRMIEHGDRIKAGYILTAHVRKT